MVIISTRCLIIPGTESIILDTAKREIVIVTATGDIVRKDVSEQLEEPKPLQLRTPGEIFTVLIPKPARQPP